MWYISNIANCNTVKYFSFLSYSIFAYNKLDWVKVLRRHKIGHFGDVLPSQFLGLVLKKLNPTQQKQANHKQNDLSWHIRTHRKQNLNKHTKISKTNMQKCKNCSHACISLYTTVVHNTALRNSDYLPSYPPDNKLTELSSLNQLPGNLSFSIRSFLLS